jgi:membrane protein
MFESKADHDRHSWLEPPRFKDTLDSLHRRIAKSRLWKVLELSIKNFMRNNDPLWASALTYTTTLAIVPILALALSTVSVLHAGGSLHDFIRRYLAAGSPEIADRILSFVLKADNRTLSAFGGVALLVTAVMTLGAVEQAFNNIFHVAEARSWARKVADYVSIVFAVPPIIVLAVALREGVASFLPDWIVLRWVLSGLTVCGAISFLYVFFPYTKVRGIGAVVGAFAATLLLELAQRAFVHFQYGVSSYQAIYGALAAIPIFMTWTYVSWTILLFGGELAAALQSGESLRSQGQLSSQDMARAAALLMMLRLAERMTNRREHVDADAIAGELGVAPEALVPIVDGLKSAGLIIDVRDRQGEARRQGLFLARDPGLISLAEVLEHAGVTGSATVRDPRVLRLLRLGLQGEKEVLAPLTVRDLLDCKVDDSQSLEQREPQTSSGFLAKFR